MIAKQLIAYLPTAKYGNIVGMFDDFIDKGKIKFGRPILGNIKHIPELFKKKIFDEIAIAVGYPSRRFRKEVFDFLTKNKIPLMTFIHPTSYVDPSAVIGKGCIVLMNGTICAHATLKENVFVGPCSLVSHDVIIGAHSFLAPAVRVAGGTRVGECCFLGINTIVINEIKLGKNVQTAAGSVVTKNLPDHVLAAGIPAKIKKRNLPF